MAFSSITLSASGAGPYSLSPLDYLSVTHLSVTVNGTPASATFNAQNRTFTLAAAPAAGATIVVQRTTPRLEGQRLTQFLSLTTGLPGLSAALLDQDYRQNLLVVGESRDVQQVVATNSGLAVAVGTGQWDAVTKRIESLADGVADTDMATKGQLDAIVAASPSNLPAVSGADNDDGLFVVGGAWAKRTPAQARTHLGLGTVATLTSGNGASQVPVYDGSAFYPALDGRNIDLTNHALNTEIGKRARTTIVHMRRNAVFTAPSLTASTWSQSSSSRVAMIDTGCTRTELDAGTGELDAGVAGVTTRWLLAAGTWRLEWSIRLRNTTGGGTDFQYGFKVTDAVDSASQVVYYDIGTAYVFSTAGNQLLSIFADSVIVAGSSAFTINFRMANRAGNSLIDVLNFNVLAHKVSTAFTFA